MKLRKIGRRHIYLIENLGDVFHAQGDVTIQAYLCGERRQTLNLSQDFSIFFFSPIYMLDICEEYIQN